MTIADGEKWRAENGNDIERASKLCQEWEKVRREALDTVVVRRLNRFRQTARWHVTTLVTAAGGVPKSAGVSLIHSRDLHWGVLQQIQHEQESASYIRKNSMTHDLLSF